MNKGTIVMILIVVALVAIIGLLVWSMADKNAEIRELKNQQESLLKEDQRKKELIDSATQVIGKQNDSLKIAKHTIIIIDAELKNLHITTQRKIRRYEDIIFVRYATDSIRWRELSKVYPSINN